MDNISAIEVIRKIYVETNDIYVYNRQHLGENDLGYKILYGPPHVNCPILFIGDQPGGKVANEKTERTDWPDHCEYGTQTWTLARNMQVMFGAEFLDGCVGVNANFFRAPSAKSWQAVPKVTRDALEVFCRNKLLTLIDGIKPRQIVTIGLATLKKFGPTEAYLHGTKNRVLMRRSKIGERLAYATLHLSGAQIAKDDRLKISLTLRELVAAH